MKTAGVIVLAGLLAACSSVNNRKNERQSDYQSLPPSTKALVDQGRIEAGMDTNAVYLAWGPPTEISDGTGPEGAQMIWIYSGTRAVHVPGWSYLPEPRGYGTVEYNPNHYSGRVPKAQVLFQDGRVVAYKRF